LEDLSRIMAGIVRKPDQPRNREPAAIPVIQPCLARAFSVPIESERKL
jgi:hypothetical protein